MSINTGAPSTKTVSAELRRERLAAELRANLAKRKAQARARAKASDGAQPRQAGVSGEAEPK